MSEETSQGGRLRVVQGPVVATSKIDPQRRVAVLSSRSGLAAALARQSAGRSADIRILHVEEPSEPSGPSGP